MLRNRIILTVLAKLIHKYFHTKLYAFILVVFLLPYSMQGQTTLPLVDTIDKKIMHAMKLWEVPGVAIGIVHNGEFVLSKGYGVLSVNSKKKVNNETVFGIASLSKTFTALAAVSITKQDNISLKKPISEYLNSFQLYDEYVTSVITFEDVLSHRSGLQNFSGDLIWYASNIEPHTILSRIKYLKPKYGFREHYGYSNLMFLVAGETLHSITDKEYAVLVDSMFFKPLKMDYTSIDFNKAMNSPNLALPHIDCNGKTEIIEYVNWNNMQPAGGIFSTTNDLTHYMLMCLSKGKYNDIQVVDSMLFDQMWKPRINVSLSFIDTQMGAPVNFKSYGLGWSMMDFSGHKVVYHNGGLDGIVSQLFLVPDNQFGMVILSNKTSPLPVILMYEILDAYLNKNDRDWSGELYNLINSSIQAPGNNIDSVETENITNPDFYCGKYYDSLAGEAVIDKQGSNLFLDFKESTIFKGVLKQEDMLVFKLNWPKMPSLPSGKVYFSVTGEGVIDGFTIDLPNPDMHFDELEFTKVLNE